MSGLSWASTCLEHSSCQNQKKAPTLVVTKLAAFTGHFLQRYKNNNPNLQEIRFPFHNINFYAYLSTKSGWIYTQGLRLGSHLKGNMAEMFKKYFLQVRIKSVKKPKIETRPDSPLSLTLPARMKFSNIFNTSAGWGILNSLSGHQKQETQNDKWICTEQ